MLLTLQIVYTHSIPRKTVVKLQFALCLHFRLLHLLLAFSALDATSASSLKETVPTIPLKCTLNVAVTVDGDLSY